MHRAPSIAVPARLATGTSDDPRVEGANRIFHDVVSLVAENGMSPVVIDNLDIDLSEFGGVVLPGGGDIDPALYGGESSPAVYDVNPDQDALDLGLARMAVEHGLPVLGICRGAQLLNVLFGGTLHADLAPTQVAHSYDPDKGEEPGFVWHPVSLTEGSALATELDTTEIMVASGHHQGIDRLADDLTPTATAADGLVEAFEHKKAGIIGVQWHPEAEDIKPVDQNAPFRVLAQNIKEVTANV